MDLRAVGYDQPGTAILLGQNPSLLCFSCILPAVTESHHGTILPLASPQRQEIAENCCFLMVKVPFLDSSQTMGPFIKGNLLVRTKTKKKTLGFRILEASIRKHCLFLQGKPHLTTTSSSLSAFHIGSWM